MTSEKGTKCGLQGYLKEHPRLAAVSLMLGSFAGSLGHKSITNVLLYPLDYYNPLELLWALFGLILWFLWFFSVPLCLFTLIQEYLTEHPGLTAISIIPGCFASSLIQISILIKLVSPLDYDDYLIIIRSWVFVGLPLWFLPLFFVPLCLFAFIKKYLTEQPRLTAISMMLGSFFGSSIQIAISIILSSPMDYNYPLLSIWALSGLTLWISAVISVPLCLFAFTKRYLEEYPRLTLVLIMLGYLAGTLIYVYITFNLPFPLNFSNPLTWIWILIGIELYLSFMFSIPLYLFIFILRLVDSHVPKFLVGLELESFSVNSTDNLAANNGTENSMAPNSSH